MQFLSFAGCLGSYPQSNSLSEIKRKKKKTPKSWIHTKLLPLMNVNNALNPAQLRKSYLRIIPTEQLSVAPELAKLQPG